MTSEVNIDELLRKLEALAKRGPIRESIIKGVATKRRTVYLTIYYQDTCPACQKLKQPDSPLFQAINEVKDKVEVQIRWVNVGEMAGYLEAEYLGIKYTPTIYINGELLDPQYYFNKEMLVKILLGIEPPRKPKAIRRIGTWIKPLTRKIGLL